MMTFVVWKKEYPEDGGVEVRAETPEEAKEKYIEQTGFEGRVELLGARPEYECV